MLPCMAEKGNTREYGKRGKRLCFMCTRVIFGYHHGWFTVRDIDDNMILYFFVLCFVRFPALFILSLFSVRSGMVGNE